MSDILSDSVDTPNTTASPGSALPPSGAMTPRNTWMTLIFFLLVAVITMIDRQAVSIVAEDLKADLGLTDAQLGFVYGTALSVFFAIFSIPFGRYNDLGSRKKMLAFCATAWSLMIFFTGFAKNFVSFALVRIGVGVGEAGSGPPLFSIVSDLVPKKFRATAISFVGSGAWIGMGAGIVIGSAILTWWGDLYPDPASAPFGLKPWQMVFILIALPGPILSLLLLTLIEPHRGEADGVATQPAADSKPLRGAFVELQRVIPLLCLPLLYKDGGFKAIKTNLLGGLGILILALILIFFTDSTSQWTALGFGLWCLFSWAQSLELNDKVAFSMVFKSPATIFSFLGLAMAALVMNGVAAWVVPYLIREHGVTPGDVGIPVGFIMAGCGLTGVLLGGMAADYLAARFSQSWRLYVAIVSTLLSVPFAVLFTTADSVNSAYVYMALFFFFITGFSSTGPTVANMLAMPRMRGVATGLFLLVVYIFGNAMGPYVTGRFSDMFAAGGAAPDQALQLGIWCSLFAAVLMAIFLTIAARSMQSELDTMTDRARALGEKI